jgi:hypothetical protein
MASSVARKFGSRIDFGNRRVCKLDVNEIVELARSIKVF